MKKCLINESAKQTKSRHYRHADSQRPKTPRSQRHGQFMFALWRAKRHHQRNDSKDDENSGNRDN